MRRRPGHTSALFVGVCFLGLILLAACKKEPAPEPTPGAEPQPVEVTGITLGSAIGADRRVTEETAAFGPTDTIYVSVGTDGVSSGATLSARWTYEDGQVVDESSQTIAPSGPEVTEFHVSKPDGWPVGKYQVVISLDGAQSGAQEFEVTAGGG